MVYMINLISILFSTSKKLNVKLICTVSVILCISALYRETQAQRCNSILNVNKSYVIVPKVASKDREMAEVYLKKKWKIKLVANPNGYIFIDR